MPAMTPRFTVGINRAFGRKPCREPVPFQEILPLKLKDTVSGKGEKTSGLFGLTKICLQKFSKFVYVKFRCCLLARYGCDAGLFKEE